MQLLKDVPLQKGSMQEQEVHPSPPTSPHLAFLDCHALHRPPLRVSPLASFAVQRSQSLLPRPHGLAADRPN
jgi:hypothetical protein